MDYKTTQDNSILSDEFVKNRTTLETACATADACEEIINKLNEKLELEILTERMKNVIIANVAFKYKVNAMKLKKIIESKI